MESKPVTQATCSNNVKNMMQEIKDVSEEVGEVKDSVNDLRVDIAGIPEKILEKADERYAGKTVEKLVYFIVGLVVTAIVGAFMALILK